MMDKPVSELMADRRTIEEQRLFESEAVSAHYDRCPEAFSLVLGPTMTYAAGIFNDPDEDLETGQNRKAAFIENSLRLGDGIRLLDVGCGWGSFLLPYAQQYDGQFHGITLSETQAEYLNDRTMALGIADRINIRVGHIESLPLADDSYDAILFSGSIIHMHHRAEVHKLVGRILRPGGVLFISDSYVPLLARDDCNSRGTQFIYTIFGSGRMLSLSAELALIESAGLVVHDVQERTESYVVTLGRWIRNIREHRASIEKLVPGMAKDFQSYMMLAKHCFQQRSLLEYTIVAQKPA